MWGNKKVVVEVETEAPPAPRTAIAVQVRYESRVDTFFATSLSTNARGELWLHLRDAVVAIYRKAAWDSVCVTQPPSDKPAKDVLAIEGEARA